MKLKALIHCNNILISNFFFARFHQTNKLHKPEKEILGWTHKSSSIKFQSQQCRHYSFTIINLEEAVYSFWRAPMLPAAMVLEKKNSAMDFLFDEEQILLLLSSFLMLSFIFGSFWPFSIKWQRY